MYKKNVAGQHFCFQGVDATTGGIKSAVSWTVRRCIDGTFAAATGTVTEDGSTGWYKFALSQADTNGNNIGFNFTGSGAVPQTVNIITDGAPPSVLLADSVTHGGSAATLSLKNVIVNAATGDAVSIGATAGSGVLINVGGNNHAINANGSGTGSGMKLSAGATGHAFWSLGGSTSGDSYRLQSNAGTIALENMAALVWAAGGRSLSNPSGIQKNVALSNFEFLMFDATTGNPTAGYTVTATRSIDGAAAAACANSASEVGDGLYKINLAATDLNGDVITLRFAATGAKDTFITILTEP